MPNKDSVDAYMGYCNEMGITFETYKDVEAVDQGPSA